MIIDCVSTMSEPEDDYAVQELRPRSVMNHYRLTLRPIDNKTSESSSEWDSPQGTTLFLSNK